MLRTGLFTFPAANACASGPALACHREILRFCTIRLTIGLLHVHRLNNARNTQFLRASLHAVFTGRTWNRRAFAHLRLGLAQGTALCLIHFPHCLHGHQVIFHLLKAGHAGQDRHHTVKRHGKAKRP